jgi:hypothetical protein
MSPTCIARAAPDAQRALAAPVEHASQTIAQPSIQRDETTRAGTFTCADSGFGAGIPDSVPDFKYVSYRCSQQRLARGRVSAEGTRP